MSSPQRIGHARPEVFDAYLNTPVRVYCGARADGKRVAGRPVDVVKRLALGVLLASARRITLRRKRKHERQKRREEGDSERATTDQTTHTYLGTHKQRLVKTKKNRHCSRVPADDVRRSGVVGDGRDETHESRNIRSGRAGKPASCAFKGWTLPGKTLSKMRVIVVL